MGSEFATTVVKYRKLAAPLDVQIDGVEVTQAIQYYRAKRHLSDPSQRAPDNAVRLVVGKPAWVRVYLRSGVRSFGSATATLEVQRRRINGTYGAVAAPQALPPGSLIPKTDPPYKEERGEMTSLPIVTVPGSINFIVPAAVMAGSLRFHVKAIAGSVIDGVYLPGLHVDTRDVDIDVDLRQTLRIRTIMVGYAGPTSSSDPAPLFLVPPAFPADLLTTAAAWTLPMFPVQSAMEYTSGGWVGIDRPLDDGAGCTPNWDALFTKLLAQQVADGNRSDAIYYALLPAKVPFREAQNRVGCEREGVNVGRVHGQQKPAYATDGGRVMAHLVGHECGLLHAPGRDGFEGVDPDYPAYPPYDPVGVPKGIIGEYGGSVGTEGVWVNWPQTVDVMGNLSSAGGPWLSLYHYGKLLDNPRLNPIHVRLGLEAFVSPKYADATDVSGMISIIGVMRSPREIDVRSVVRLPTRALPAPPRTTGLTVTLLDENGAVKAEAPLLQLARRGDLAGCGCRGHAPTPHYPCVVYALLPDTERGARLTIRDGERDLWTRTPASRAPLIARVEASVNGDRLMVGWHAEGAEGRPEVWLQWSEDEGTTWNALASMLDGYEAAFDTAPFPAGTILLRLLASDGFDTVASQEVRVQVPDRPPAVTILSPLDGARIPAGSALRLWAAVTVDGRGASQIERSQWLVDGERAGESLDGFVPAPAAGEHEIALTVIVGGRQSVASHRFVTVESSEYAE